MNATSVESELKPPQSTDARRQLLEFARHLDRFGRDTEDFLSRQLEQLERAIDEFERDKAAWRRQLRRESSQLADQREQLERMKSTTGKRSRKSRDGATTQRGTAEVTARKSGEAPMRILVQPRRASPMQVGVLLFELSKLNRDMGGQGIRFEIAEVRAPKKRLLGPKVETGTGTDIMELSGFPTLPLKARGSHVVLDADLTDRVEEWILFKTRLLQSALAEGELAVSFRRCRVIERRADTRTFIREATQHHGQTNSRENEPDPYSGAAVFANTQIDVVRQQVLRLESCYERLNKDSGLLAQIEL
jgi:hypothetical protein